MNPLSVFILALQLTRFTNAQPAIVFPLNSQLPPVARIGREFSYVFSEATFVSANDITYTLGEHPAWLSLDSKERRLHGKPDDESVPSGDVVGQMVDIIATDATGSTTLNAVLVASRHKGPFVKIPMEQQISKFGLHSAPSSILTFPRTSFRYTFDPNTFDHDPSMINYYAVSANNSPLPSWIKFDASTLTFSGITPPFETLIQPPQTFDFELVASDIVGFSAVALPFSIVVGTHKLTADNPIITLNATRGSKVSFDTLQREIKLDGMVVKPQDVRVSTTEMPPWLKFQFDSWKIEGTPQENDRSTNFTVKFGDNYDDSLEVLVIVNVATGLFQSTLKDIEIKPGDEINIDLASNFRNPADIEAKLSTEPPQDWLKLDGLILSGTVPESAEGDLKINIEAKSKSTGLTETETLGVRFLALDTQAHTATSTDSASTATSASPHPTRTKGSHKKDDEEDGDDAKHFSTSTILLATIIPVLAIALLIMLLVCLFRRRRARRNYLTSKSQMNISKPIVGSLRVNGSDTSLQHVEKTADVGKADNPSYPPAHRGYTEVNSQTSTVLRVSTSSGIPPFFESSRDFANSGIESERTSTDNHQSWFTIEVSATPSGSVTTRGNSQSRRAFPEGRQQLLPPPEFHMESPETSIAGSIDIDIPMLDDQHRIPATQTAILAYNATGHVKTRKSSEELSGEAPPTTSPEPAGDDNLAVAKSVSISRPAVAPLATVQGPTSAQHSALPEESSQDKLDELKALNEARISSHQWLTQHQSGPFQDVESSNASRNLGRESMSMGSVVNWRTHARQPARSPTYDELVSAAPFHPSRPSTVMLAGVLHDGAQSPDRGSQEWMSPSRWGANDPGLKRRTDPAPGARLSTSLDSHAFTSLSRMTEAALQEHSSKRLSRLTETSSLDGAGDRKVWLAGGADDKTPKVSEGSFKMFI